jgi:hypothetical protein
MGFERAATIETFGYLAQQLYSRGVAYIQWARWFALLDPTNRGTKDVDVVADLAPLFKGANLLNGDYTAESAGDAVAAGQAAAIVFGRPFISVRGRRPRRAFMSPPTSHVAHRRVRSLCGVPLCFCPLLHRTPTTRSV